jgi:threonine/serine exporter ThrE
LLAYLGAAMVATGQPVSDVEDELAEVGAALGYPDVQIAASPTGVMLNLASGAPATFESVKGGLCLDQAADRRFLSLSFGTGWAKSKSFTTGRVSGHEINRQSMMAILHDKVHIARAVNAAEQSH